MISDGLFGMNYELTRTTWYGGLSAQLINNRKLYARDGKAPSFWTVTGAHDAQTGGGIRFPLSEEAVCLEQSNERMRLKTRQLYEYRVCLTLVGEADLYVSAGEDACCAHALYGNGARVTLTGSFFPKDVSDKRVFSVRATGKGTLTVHCVSLIAHGSVINGLRADAVAALAALSPSALRFPGGCYAEYYDWKSGLLPQDERSVIDFLPLEIVCPDTDHQDPQDMDTDDFLALCKLTGAEAQLTVRTRDREPEDAARWVAYCNLGADDEYGNLRARRGHVTPYAVRTWYVGNELYYMRDGSPDYPEKAARKSVAFARAMKRTDPTIRLIPSSGSDEEWNVRFLGEIIRIGGDGLFDLASYHQYMLDVLPCAANIGRYGELKTDEELQACLYSPEQIILPRLEAMRGEMTRVGGRFSGMPFVLDEWNYQWGRRAHPAMALFVAAMLNTLIRNAERLGLTQALYFHPVNEGLIFVRSDRVEVDDAGLIWQMFRAHAGKTLRAPSVTASSDCADIAESALDHISVTTLVNRSATEAISCALPPSDNIARVTLTGYRAAGGMKNGFTPGSMQAFTPSVDANGQFTLPPASVAKADIEWKE